MSATPHPDLSRFLGSFLTENRRQRIEEVLSRRTRKLTVVLEDIFQPQNASAVIRSCDCFGIQDLHVIENRNTYTLNPDVELGSAQWISLRRWEKEEKNTEACLNHLKKEGYILFATSPHNPDLSVHEIPVNQKIALLFGTELKGLSPLALEMSDYKVMIPMEGFTESFNISVSAALCMYDLRRHINETDNWALNQEETEALRLNWYRLSLPRAGDLETEFYKRLKENGKAPI